jgi:hypothetical protein
MVQNENILDDKELFSRLDKLSKDELITTIMFYYHILRRKAEMCEEPTKDKEIKEMNHIIFQEVTGAMEFIDRFILFDDAMKRVSAKFIEDFRK